MSTPLLPAGPLEDPEAHLATTSAHVECALDGATVAAADAQLHWRLMLDALERNVEVAAAARGLERAIAEAGYRWSIYHAAAADAARHGRAA